MVWNDTRAQSIQIGAVLLFGIFIILLASWQAFGIPNQNEGIEFNHNQEVQQQLTELRTTANSMLEASATRSATVDLGVRYPSRTLFVNPPPAAGTIRSVDMADPNYNITIRNGTPEDTNLRQLWRDIGPDGNDTISLNTGAIAYDPGYNEYQNPPQTIYEHSVLYNLFALEDQTLALTEQSLIKDDRLTIVTLNGTLSENRIDSASVDFEPLSTQTRTVEITASNGPLTLEFPTRLAISEWRSLLGDSYNVTGVTDGPFAQNDEVQTVRIQAESSSETYQLQLAKVGVGVGTTQPEPAYVTTVNRDSEPVTVGDTYEFTVEVRDKYNKPKGGIPVNASASEGTLESTSEESGLDGQATFIYNSSEVTVSNTQVSDHINVSIADGYNPGPSHNSTSPENLTLTVNITDIPQSEAGSNGSVGVGTGSISKYDNESPSETFSLPNGRWVGITCTDQLLLSNGQPSIRPNGNLQGDVIRFNGQFNNSTGDTYIIDVRLARGSGNSFNTKTVKIRNDETGNSREVKLTRAAANKVYTADAVDLLDISNYQKGPSSSWAKSLKQIRDLERNKPVVWQTSRMIGRVTVALECDPPPDPPASGVSAIDGTTPPGESSALEFKIQVASGSTKTITSINITTPGKQNNNVQSAKQLKRTGNDNEVRLTASNTNGMNQSGDLKKNIKLDGTNYTLDTNAVFSDGAILNVDMGDIDGGNVKWRYELVASESNADVVVTFSFQNGPSFRAYLQVTNVNS